MKIEDKIINEKHFYGILSIFKNKEKIFENHNMILTPGINLIIKCLTTDLKFLDCFWKAKLGGGSQINSENFESDDFVFLKNNNEEIESFSFVNLSIIEEENSNEESSEQEETEEISSEEETNTVEFFKGENKNIIVNCSFIGKTEGQVFEIKEFGLFFKEPNENNEKIFSRVILDPFVLIPEEKYTIEYKIYF